MITPQAENLKMSSNALPVLWTRRKYMRPAHKRRTDMYYEEKMINGVLMYRTKPDGEWLKASPERVEQRLIELSEENKQLEKDLAKYLEPKKPQQWEPPAGDWYVDINNCVDELCSDELCRLAGRERATPELAEAAAKKSYSRDKLEAFRDEGWPGEVGDWCVWFDKVQGDWRTMEHYSIYDPCTVYGPYYFAEEAARMLNSGELVL